MIKSLTSLVFVLFLSLININAQNIHVATTGSYITSDGSIDNSYKTINYAAKQTVQGITDTVFIHEGTYQNEDFNNGDIWSGKNIAWSKNNKWALGVLAEPVTNLTCEGNIIYNKNGAQSVYRTIAQGWTELNPQFNNVAINDYSLAQNSPAINAGSANINTSYDIKGKARNDMAPDAGAFENIKEEVSMVCNPGFESGLNDWAENTNGGAVAFSNETTDVYAGDISLKASVTTEALWQNRIESCNMDFVAGHEYKISLWAKTLSGNPAEIKVILKDATTSVFTPAVSTITGTDYKELVYSFTPDADMSAFIRISFRNIAEYLIDDISIVDVSYIDCNNDLNGLAYIDNCGVCVGGNTGVTSSCTVTENTGVSRTFNASYFGFNTKNIGDNNYRKDSNIIEAWKKTKAKIYRYPGGTFGNSFDWHTGTTIIGGRPPQVDPPVTPAHIAKALPTYTEILWMVNVRVPTPVTGYDWRVLTRAELLSEEVLAAKTQDILDGIAAFAAAGKTVKYLELGNEFYFSADEGFGEAEGAGGDGGNFQGDHFPYDQNPSDYIHQMAHIARAVKQEYPEIKIAVIQAKIDNNFSTQWNSVITDSLAANPQMNADIDAVTMHWYQNEIWYENQAAEMPQISNVASCKTAMGFAFDYLTYKKENDLLQIPDEKELWLTEGDIHDPSPAGTWLEGIREGVIQLDYLLESDITMNTPHMFQPTYVAPNLKLTAKGKVASMIYAAGEDMTLVEEVNLGGGVFFGEFGGPYPELLAVKFSDGVKEKFIFINCSENTYSNLDISTLLSATNLKMYQRHTPTPWSSDSPAEQIENLVSNAVTILPYSLTILAEQYVINDLVQYDFKVCNPSSDFPDNLVMLYEFSTTIEAGESTMQTLEIKNDGMSSLTLANNPLSLKYGSNFSITQPSALEIAAGASELFNLAFSPSHAGEMVDTLNVLTVNGKTLQVVIKGNAIKANNNLICNSGFEDGFTDWTTYTNNGAVTYGVTIHNDSVFNGSNSFRANVKTADSFANRIESCSTINLNNGKAYKVSFYAKVKGSIGDIKTVIKSGSTTYFDEITSINSESWLQYSYVIYPTQDLPLSFLRLSFRDVTTYYIDDVSIEELVTEPVEYACDTSISNTVEGYDIILNSYGLVNTLDTDSSTMYYCNNIMNEEHGGGYYLDYVDQGGSGMDAYPNVTVGGIKSGGVYTPADKTIVGMPVQIQDLSAAMNFEWITSQEHAFDEDDKWMASINFIFDAVGTENSEPVSESRDYDLVIKSQSHNFADDLNDLEKENAVNTAFWYFARWADGTLRPYEYKYKGVVYQYAVRYKFFIGSESKDDKVHVKLIPYGSEGVPPITKLNVTELIAVSKEYYNYANLPAEQLALAKQKVAIDGTWLKSINAGYEVYAGKSMLNTEKFKVNLGTVDSVTACNTYLWDKNLIEYTESGDYSAVVANAQGYDSTVFLNLTIVTPYSKVEDIESCDSYYWDENGITYTESGTYEVIHIDENGCDSVLTLNLEILNSNSGSETVAACDNYKWQATGLTYTQSGTYTATLTNINGCDSLATLFLTINKTNTNSQWVTSCFSYVWSANSEEYFESGEYTETLTNIYGCDSVVTLNLTIKTIDNSVSQTDNILQANLINAKYQWLNCDNNYSKINGETSQIFAATENGNYAVEISKNNCTDTSNCFTVSTIGVIGRNLSTVLIYPNPVNKELNIDLGKHIANLTITVRNIYGAVVMQQNNLDGTNHKLKSTLHKGIYFVELKSEFEKTTIKIIQE